MTKFVDYEKKVLQSTGNKIAALDIKCGNNAGLKKLINKIHNLTEENWFEIKTLKDLTKEQIEFFDVVFFNDCDLVSDLREMLKFNFNVGTSIYYNTTTFNTVLLECLTKEERIKLFKKSDNYDYKILVTTILKKLFENTGYTVLEYKIGSVHFHSFIKTNKSFEFDKKFEKLLKTVQKEISENEYKKELDKTQRDNIWNYLTDEFIVGGHINVEKMCRTLDIEDCNEDTVQGYIENVCNALKTVGNQIEENAITSNDKKLIFDFDITSLENWTKFVQRYENRVKQLLKQGQEVNPSIPLPLLGGLKNVGGFSCFMDSVLFAMFVQKHGFFVEEILNKKITAQDTTYCEFDTPEKGIRYLKDFQKTLQKLADLIQKGERGLTCIPVQKQLEKCNDRTRLLMEGEQQDDADFLGALMEVFNSFPTIVEKINYKSQDNKNWIKSSSAKSAVSLIEAYLPSESKSGVNLMDIIQQIQVNNYQNVPIESWIKDDDGKTYQFLATVENIINTNQLVIHTPRKNFVENKFVKNKTPVNFTEFIKNNDRMYELTAVTIHHGSASGGHYTCFCKINSVWIHYDDMKQGIQIVTFKNVLAENKNTSLFFYSPYKTNIEF